MQRKLRRDGKTALLFLAPLFVMYLVYFGYSFYFLVDMSFKKVSITFTDAAQVGWKNYELLFKDPAFIRSIVNNLVFAATTIIVSLTIAFFIAAALATGLRARRLYYVIFLIPALMPVALVATMFNVMLEYQGGALNQTLRELGLGSLAQHWLTQPQWAIAAVISLFAYLIGLPIMYYTADLATVRIDSIEAAVIDGAGTFRILRSVLHPMLRATHITIILALLLGSFRAFEIVLLSTGGGPSDNTEIVGTYIYGYVTSAGSTIGFASAASVVVLLVALLGSAVQMLFTRKSTR